MGKKIFFLGIILLLAGCRVIPENEGKRILSVRREEDALSARKAGNDLLESIRENDFSLFRKTLEKSFPEKLSERDFSTSRDAMQKQFGSIRNFRFLTGQKIPVFQSDLWLVSFEKKNRDGSLTETELLFRLVSVKEQNFLRITGFGFF